MIEARGVLDRGRRLLERIGVAIDDRELAGFPHRVEHLIVSLRCDPERLRCEVGPLEHGPVLGGVEGRGQEIHHRIRGQARLDAVGDAVERIARRAGVGEDLGHLDLARRGVARLRGLDEEVILALAPVVRLGRLSLGERGDGAQQQGKQRRSEHGATPWEGRKLTNSGLHSGS